MIARQPEQPRRLECARGGCYRVAVHFVRVKDRELPVCARHSLEVQTKTTEHVIAPMPQVGTDVDDDAGRSRGV